MVHFQFYSINCTTAMYALQYMASVIIPIPLLSKVPTAELSFAVPLGQIRTQQKLAVYVKFVELQDRPSD